MTTEVFCKFLSHRLHMNPRPCVFADHTYLQLHGNQTIHEGCTSPSASCQDLVQTSPAQPQVFGMASPQSKKSMADRLHHAEHVIMVLNLDRPLPAVIPSKGLQPKHTVSKNGHKLCKGEWTTAAAPASPFHRLPFLCSFTWQASKQCSIAKYTTTGSPLSANPMPPRTMGRASDGSRQKKHICDPNQHASFNNTPGSSR